MFRDKKYRDFKTRLSEEPEPHSQYDLSSYRLPSEESVRDPFQHVQGSDLSSYRSPTEESVCTPSQNVQSSDVNDTENNGGDIFYGQRETDDIRLVLLGRTGSGKSATGNTILTKKEFLSKASGSSITEQCQIAQNRSAGHRFIVVDTPGLFDTKLAHGEVTREIIRCIHMSTPGPHAFLLVLRLDRFTQEEIDTFTCLFELFGEKMSSHAIILFTRLDDLDEESTNIDDFINSSNESLKHFINKVEGRYIAFNNRGTEEQKSLQVANLNKALKQMIKNNGGSHYTNKMYEEAEAHLRKRIQKVEQLKALEKQREIENIESKFKGQMLELKTNNNMLEKDLKKQKTDNESIKSEKEKSQALIQSMHLEMKLLHENHQRDLYEVKEEAKRQEERKMRELQIREDEIQRQVQEMSERCAETQKQMQMLVTDRQTALKEQQNNYQLLMKQNVKTEILELQNLLMESTQQKLKDSEEQTQRAIEKQEELIEAMNKARQESQLKDEMHQKYVKNMTSTAEKLQKDVKRITQQNKELQQKSKEKNDNCSII